MKSLVEFLKESNVNVHDVTSGVAMSIEDYCEELNIGISENAHYQYMNDVFAQSDIINCGANTWDFYDYFISESLNHSLTSSKLLELIKKVWPNQDIQGLGKDKNTLLELSSDKNFFKDLINSNNESFLSILRISNYFVLSCNEYDIKLHPWKPEEVTDKIYKENNGIVYHITTKENWEKIQKYGVSPKGKGEHQIHDKDKEREEYINSKLLEVYRPKLIYVLTKNSEGQFKWDSHILAGLLKRTRKIYNEWRIYDEKVQKEMNDTLDDLVILKINLKEYEYKYRVWKDPAYRGINAYFLSEYIPPMIIELEKEI